MVMLLGEINSPSRITTGYWPRCRSKFNLLGTGSGYKVLIPLPPPKKKSLNLNLYRLEPPLYAWSRSRFNLTVKSAATEATESLPVGNI